MIIKKKMYLYIKKLSYSHLTPVFWLLNINLELLIFPYIHKWLCSTENPFLNAMCKYFWLQNNFIDMEFANKVPHFNVLFKWTNLFFSFIFHWVILNERWFTAFDTYYLVQIKLVFIQGNFKNCTLLWIW